jgi:hypothetical protein
MARTKRSSSRTRSGCYILSCGYETECRSGFVSRATGPSISVRRWNAPCAGLAPTVSTCSISTASIRPCRSTRWPTRSVVWSSRGSYDFRSFRGRLRQPPPHPCRRFQFPRCRTNNQSLPTATSRTGIVTANGSGQVALHEVLVHASFG